ncbi:Hypothetical protein A7982_09708 [Minicystis rosea]|nr:Hypothetical protein A7982_09708 [Minicystis rosea]
MGPAHASCSCERHTSDAKRGARKRSARLKSETIPRLRQGRFVRRRAHAAGKSRFTRRAKAVVARRRRAGTEGW